MMHMHEDSCIFFCINNGEGSVSSGLKFRISREKTIQFSEGFPTYGVSCEVNIKFIITNPIWHDWHRILFVIKSGKYYFLCFIVNALVKWIAFLLHIWEGMGLILGSPTDPPGKC
jgi:trehalose utilization protein